MLVRWFERLTRRSQDRPYQADAPEQFLIIGNGRTGSTWLLTSMDMLADVKARHEIKWTSSSIHISEKTHAVAWPNSSMREIIQSVTDDPFVFSTISGSKLIFNPYEFYFSSVFSNLSKVIEPTIKLILLKRSYLESWLSWKVRGVYHEVNKDALPRGPQRNLMLDAIKDMERPDNQHLVLHHQGGALDDFSREATAYPLITAVDDFLQAFSNDVQALHLVKHRNGMTIDYRAIQDRFPEVVRFVGSNATETEIGAILSNPQTLKLPQLDRYLHPIEPLRELSDALDTLFLEAATGQRSLKSAWSWKSAKVGVIQSVEVSQILSKYGFKTDGESVRWRIQRPLLK